MTANPAKGVSAPRKQRPLPKTLMSELKWVNPLDVNEDDPLSIRDRAMMEVDVWRGITIGRTGRYQPERCIG